MRKRSNLNNRLLPRVTTSQDHASSHYSKEEDLSESKYVDPLEKFQLQLSKSQQMPPVRFKVNKRVSTYHTISEESQRPTIYKNLAKASKEIADLRKQLKKKRSSSKQNTESIVQTMITRLGDSLSRRRSQMPAMQQPIYYPVPMPFPMYMPPINHHQASTIDHNGTRSSFKNDTIYLRKNKIKSKQNRALRIKKNMRTWKKVAHCVLFTIYLKRFCKLVQGNRKKMFEQQLPKIKNSLNIIRKNMTDCLRPFFKLIALKKDVEFDIFQDDNKEIMREKVVSIRKLIAMIFDGLMNFVKENGNKVEIIECLYFLCKHGNYSCTQPFLTKEEMELTCISPVFNYVSADKNLQKAALINLIIFKLVLYNMLLSPQKVGQEYALDTIVDNLYVISSVVYEFAIDFQDEYMLQVPSLYKIGNYEGMSKVRVLESISVKGRPQRPGEIISGLKDQDWTQKYFNFKSWSDEKKALSTIIESIQSRMAAYHRKVNEKFY